ncbi:Replicative DNA helicase [compost metagenome]
MMSDLRESGNIEQDADTISFLYRDDYYNRDTEKKNIIEIIVAKNREGSVGTAEMMNLKQYCKFKDFDYRLQ